MMGGAQLEQATYLLLQIGVALLCAGVGGVTLWRFGMHPKAQPFAYGFIAMAVINVLGMVLFRFGFGYVGHSLFSLLSIVAGIMVLVGLGNFKELTDPDQKS